MQTIKRKLPILASCLLLAGQFKASAEITISPWQLHEGPTQFIKHNTSGGAVGGSEAARKEAFNKTTIPDTGWRALEPSEIAKDFTVNIARQSKIKANAQELDFMFFQTMVTIPEGTQVKEFKVSIDQVDDGARVVLFHKDLPPTGYFDPANDIISQRSPRKIDFSAQAAKPGEYRVVVVQYDQHTPSNNIKGVRINVDGAEIMPPPPVIPPPTAALGKKRLQTFGVSGQSTQNYYLGQKEGGLGIPDETDVKSGSIFVFNIEDKDPEKKDASAVLKTSEGKYVTARGKEVVLTDEPEAGSTWLVRAPLKEDLQMADGWFSLESEADPGRYLRHFSAIAYAHKDGEMNDSERSLFKPDASWKFVPAK